MRSRFLWLSIAIWAAMAGTALILAAMPAAATGLQCAPRSTAMAAMGLHTQTRRVKAFDDGAHVAVEIYADISDRWTMIITYANGQTCLVSSGVGLETKNAPPQGQPG